MNEEKEIRDLVEQVKVISLKKGDMLIFKFKHPFSYEDIDYIEERLGNVKKLFAKANNMIEDDIVFMVCDSSLEDIIKVKAEKKNG